MHVPHSIALVLSTSALSLAPLAPASAQTLGGGQALGTVPDRNELTITPLVVEGDVIPGVGTVTSISNFVVNDSGSWIVEVATNAASEVNDVLVRDGAVYLVEGQLLAEPTGAGINTFDALTLNNAGNSGWNFFLENTGASTNDSGLYWNTELLIQESTFTTAAGFSPSTPYIGFFETKLNEANDILVIASLDDIAITSTVDQGLMLLDVDGAGNLLTETIVAAEGTVLPGQTEAVAVFATSSHNFDLDGDGRTIYTVDLNGDTTVDVAVYLDSTLVAQEGSASPAPGRNWLLSTSLTAVALNDVGGWALRGGLDGDAATNTLLVVDDLPLVQEGASLPGIAPFALTSLGSGPIRLGNDGTVLWYGDWSDPDTTVDEALFLDDEILVQEGVTRLGGVVIDILRGVSDGYTMSDNGVYVVFEAVLADGTEGAWMATRPFVRR